MSAAGPNPSGGVRLREANLTNAHLPETDLAATLLDPHGDLTLADLATAKNLTQQQLDSARGNEDTKLPTGLQRPAHWSAVGGTATGSAD